jgi:hypothetical protein
MSLASLIWGVAANFAFVPLPRLLRWGGLAVFALWAASLLMAYGWHDERAERLKAAGLVAAAAMTAICLAAYFLTRPKAAAKAA